MKNIIRLITGSVLMLFVAACSTDTTKDVFDPSTTDPSSAFFQQNAISREFPFGSTEGDIEFTIYRQNSKGEVTVGLNYTVEDDALEFIEIPNSVTFEDGKYEATVKVHAKNVTDFVKGKTYSATISLGDNHPFHEVVALDAHKGLRTGKTRASATGYTTIQVSFSLELVWEQVYVLADPSNLLADAYYALGEDGFKHDLKDGETASEENRIPLTATVYDWWGEEVTNVPVQRAFETDVFRLYGFQWDDDSKASNIIFAIEKDREKVNVGGEELYQVSLNFSYYGMYDDTADIYIADAYNTVGYRSTAAGNEENYPCVWDGGNYFDFYAFFYVHYNDDLSAYGGWGAPTGWSLEFELSTGTKADPAPEVKIEYNGITTSATGVSSATVTFTPNGDVTKYYASVVQGEMEENEALAEAFIAAAKAGKSSFTYGSGWAAKTYPIVTLTEADTREWPVTDDYYTAIAYSIHVFEDEEDKEAIENYDAVTFFAAPETHWGPYLYYIGVDTDYGWYDYYEGYGSYGGPMDGFLPSNSVFFYICAYEEADPITAVKYAAVTMDEYNSASFDNEAYLAEHGLAWSSSHVRAANEDLEIDWLFGDLKPGTEYVILIAVTGKNGTDIYEYPVETYPVGTHAAFKIATAVQDSTDAAGTYFKHSHIRAQFVSGFDSYGMPIVANGYYGAAAVKTLATNTTWGSIFSVDESGKMTLKVSEAEFFEAVAANGTQFSAGGDLLYFNVLGQSQIKTVASTTPENTIVVFGYAEYPGGEKSWAYSVATTDAAPVAPFEQTATLTNGTLRFNWTGTAFFDKQKTTQVQYALLSAEELAAAGVNTSKLADADLNGSTADEANVEAVMTALSTKAMTFTGDEAYYKINSAEGYTAEFNAPVSGTHYLVAYATTGDQYVTKLTVAAL